MAININVDEHEVPLGTIFCIGRNYVAHIEELGNQRPESPVVFCKPITALNTSGQLHLPRFSDDIHYETELVVMIGKTVKDIAVEDADQYIAAYAVGLDLTARELQTQLKTKGLPWELCKGFDNSACVSKFINKDQFKAGYPTFSLSINGQIKQEGDPSMMIFSIAEQIHFLSQYFTLREGDIIYTGTPQGVGKVNHGDQMELSLSDQLKHFIDVV